MCLTDRWLAVYLPRVGDGPNPIKFLCDVWPEQLMDNVTAEEHAALTSQSAISKPGGGGRRTRPYAFTEHGALQVANIRNSSKAEAMSIYV
jgi:hypothetical protein